MAMAACSPSSVANAHLRYLPDNVMAALPELTTQYIEALETFDCSVFQAELIVWPGTEKQVTDNLGHQRILQRLVYCRLVAESPRLCFSFHQQTYAKMLIDAQYRDENNFFWMEFAVSFLPSSNFLRIYSDDDAILILSSTITDSLYMINCVLGDADVVTIGVVARENSALAHIVLHRTLAILDKREDLCQLLMAKVQSKSLAMSLHIHDILCWTPTPIQQTSMPYLRYLPNVMAATAALRLLLAIPINAPANTWNAGASLFYISDKTLAETPSAELRFGEQLFSQGSKIWRNASDEVKKLRFDGFAACLHCSAHLPFPTQTTGQKSKDLKFCSV